MWREAVEAGEASVRAREGRMTDFAMDNIVQRWNENAPSSHEAGRVIHTLVCLLTKTGLSFTILSPKT